MPSLVGINRGGVAPSHSPGVSTKAVGTDAMQGGDAAAEAAGAVQHLPITSKEDEEARVPIQMQPARSNRTS